MSEAVVWSIRKNSSFGGIDLSGGAKVFLGSWRGREVC